MTDEIHSARTYFGLRQLFNMRRIELRMTMADVDVAAKIQSGYFAKLICGKRNFGPETFAPILKALDVKLAFVPTSVPAETERQKILQLRHAVFLKEIASKGGRVSRSRYTTAEWSKFCRRAVMKRWAKKRTKA